MRNADVAFDSIAPVTVTLSKLSRCSGEGNVKLFKSVQNKFKIFELIHLAGVKLCNAAPVIVACWMEMSARMSEASAVDVIPAAPDVKRNAWLASCS